MSTPLSAKPSSNLPASPPPWPSPPSSPLPSLPPPAPPAPSSAAPSPFPRPPRPLGTDAPATCEVPPFAPVRVRGGRYRVQRLVRHRGRAIAAGLAVTAAALVAAGPRAPADRPAAAPHTGYARGHPASAPHRQRPAELVAAPVRIADADAVRLLRPGDRVDVVAAQDTAAGSGARVLARGARVTRVPRPPDGVTEGGALIVLAVPRATATALVGAGTMARLAVTLC
ncbi:CpaB family protein [Streptomyces misionensis]|uniref:hypothetical protein n=1 Tax=Streptomyces misionensis TaxID=67331 RepID=UPI0036761BD9